jgi:hypothetical protein
MEERGMLALLSHSGDAKVKQKERNEENALVIMKMKAMALSPFETFTET